VGAQRIEHGSGGYRRRGGEDTHLVPREVWMAELRRRRAPAAPKRPSVDELLEQVDRCTAAVRERLGLPVWSHLERLGEEAAAAVAGVDALVRMERTRRRATAAGEGSTR
jgi:hypothetical protein